MQCGPGVSCLRCLGQRGAQSRERRQDSNAYTASCSCSQVSSYHNITAAWMEDLQNEWAGLPSFPFRHIWHIQIVPTVVTGASRAFIASTDIKLLFVFCVNCIELITDMLGSEKCRLVWEHVLESLQDPSINRLYILNPQNNLQWSLLLLYCVNYCINN